ncbi:MAG: alpha-galactosidase [Armatimonadetes bacterium]|nr:alpha-galactosidase [Armatimonadota bacterium]
MGSPAGLFLTVLIALMLITPAHAQGVTFRASFDHWLKADQAVGQSKPLRIIGGRLSPGRFGQALLLDGNSYLEFQPEGNVPNDAGTVAVWFRPDDWGRKTYDNFLGFSDNDVNALHFERSHPSGKLRIVLGGPDSGKSWSIYSQQPLVNGRWYHCAVAWDISARRAELFVNGVSEAMATEAGPLPSNVPALLVGCGFGRMSRAAVGALDELVILDHAANALEVQQIMNGSLSDRDSVAVSGPGLQTVVHTENGTVTFGATGGCSLVAGPFSAHVRVGEQDLALNHLSAPEDLPPIAAALGESDHRRFRGQAGAAGLATALHVQAQRGKMQALVWLEVTNQNDQKVRVTEMSLRAEGAEALMLPEPLPRLRIFTDNGSLCGSGSRDLATPGASHSAAGALVITDPEAAWAASMSFASFQTATVSNRVRVNNGGVPDAVAAVCSYPGGYVLDAGETLASEVFEFSIHPGGHAALEHWADTVMAVGDLKPPRHCVSGWNSWYAYRLTVSEDIVLDNARIIRDRFAPLGVSNIQIDHGWQHRDIIGHWVPNERFPHGLPWLSDRLREMGLSLGLWAAVTSVSEFSPEYQEHPEMLAKDAEGKPFVSWDKWYWVPHGATLAVDPTSPAGAAYYLDAGEKFRSYGCTYLKNDFQAHLIDPRMKLYDADMTLGAPVWREFTRLLRQGMGQDMAYMACNAPLNLVAGLCDAAWTHRDMGNPAGNWEHMRGWTNDFACRYHVSGKFYWSDPDYLQIGQGDEDENRIRMVICALGGGPAFLGDRLPDLPEQKLQMLAKCLPSYQRCARPVDLFARDEYAQVWDLPVKTDWGDWHVVGLLNLDELDARVTIELADIGLADGQPVVIWDFFEERLMGEIRAEEGLGLALRVPLSGTSCKLLRIAPKLERPFVLSTDMHLTQGGVDLTDVVWDGKALSLSGIAHRMKGMSGRVFVYVPDGYVPAEGKAEGNVLAVPVEFDEAAKSWAVKFAKAAR